MPVDPSVLEEIALKASEYQQIVNRLGREPNPVELGLFGALWSEHCGYKHSRPLIRLFPHDSPRVLVGDGSENAGVVDLGDNLAVAFKIESHNHPSAVEPFQGAATGVGGIVRDILTMGARPVALLNSLRFGPLNEPKQRRLFRGVIEGISWYGNCIGVPDVAGEIFFSDCYRGNPLVNAMCVGLLPKERVVRAKASGYGNLLLLVGAQTGRDGIHGASGLASRSFDQERELRPTIQAGNPFLEKVLIESCLTAIDRYPETIVGMQDLGAAGLTSSVVECAGRGGSGVLLDVSKVVRREAHMTPYEVMLSESQERMLLIIRPTGLDEILTLFNEWDLTASVIGNVTEDGMITILDGSIKVAELPIALLMDPPQYTPIPLKPNWLERLQSTSLDNLAFPVTNAEETLLKLLASPNIASREQVYRQYDHQVGTSTVIPPGIADASVIRIHGSNKAIALTVDGNGRYCYLDPYVGGAIAVSEACRNLSCVGAEPLAITDCLNFGNPEHSEVYFQMEECVKGMAAACTMLGVPVVSGNVSLYNETEGRPIYPTPVVGALGLKTDITKTCTAGFKNSGDVVILLGVSEVKGDPGDLAGSELLDLFHGMQIGRLHLDLEKEVRIQRLCQKAINLGIINSAHDCADGGLGIALAESCILGNIGFLANFECPARWDAALFGEAQSRIILSLSAHKFPEFKGLAKTHETQFCYLGKVKGTRLVIPNSVDIPVQELNQAWSGKLGHA